MDANSKKKVPGNTITRDIRTLAAPTGNITEEDLYAANPLLAQEGLKAGTVIYIPTVSELKASPKPAVQEKPAVKEQKPVVKEQKPAAVKEQPAPKESKPVVVDTKPAPTPDADGFIQHTVKWFEDIYDVAKTYGVTAQEIMAANGLKCATHAAATCPT